MTAWIEKYMLLLKLALVAILAVAAYSFGHHVASQAAAVDKAAALHDQDVANQKELARRIAETSANATKGAQDAQALTDKHVEQAAQFKIIYRDVNHYVQAHPTPAVCDLDADGLRAWNAANAGRAVSTGATHPAK